jgi:nucleoside-diphosphate-sugar epimerase
MRKEQEDIALDAGGMVIHLPDFYGPHADLSLANPIFRAALDGKRATWLGPVDKPHEFLFVPDIAPMIIELAQQDDCYGQRWNFAGAGTITPRLFITGVYRAAGRDPKWRSVSKIMLRLAGLFSAFMRELPEMYYLQETPVILDDAKLRRRLGAVHKTPYEEGIRQTFAWLNAMP